MTTWIWVTSSTTDLVIGIDPSLRHTGLCLDRGTEPPVYHEIKTGRAPVVEAMGDIRRSLASWFREQGVDREPAIWAVERQLAQGDVNGWLMMLAQVAVCEAILEEAVGAVQMVAPYPNQLKAYISRIHGVKTDSKTQIRLGQREIMRRRSQSGEAPLVSSHKAEAWFLTQMARDVLAGRWSYMQSPVKVRVFPWPIVRGGTV